jgi:triacylglycerol esterase/lipase EstA (alpha/beta hydrolase family)
MKTKLLLSIFLFGTQFQIFAQVMKPVPVENLHLNSSDLNRNIQSIQNLPYPIIFIHGLNSDSYVWDDMLTFMTNTLNLTYGGRLDFCLNANGSNSDTNKLVYSVNGNNSDIRRFNNITLQSADFYRINFDVSIDGTPFTTSSNDFKSNESAIVKQGIALKLAIQEILTLTHKDKVILMGHSMGGLCAREYLQNQDIWTEPYLNHHIAKLITTGTPHGGYEGTAIVSDPTDPIDWQSEAYRDLRSSYLFSGYNGVYLYGGIESDSYMRNNLLSNFYNVDVNCNGIVGENIVGLNQKNLYNNVDYAYIIGNCTGCPTSFAGDGVVRDYNANFNNFYNLQTPKNEFIYSALGAVEIHSDLPKQIIQNMQALDEPNFIGLGYNLDFDITYKGFIYTQPVGGYPIDYDFYKFTLTSNSQVNVLVNNFAHPNLIAVVYDSAGIAVSNFVSGNSLTPINFSQNLLAGNYSLIIYGTQPASNVDIYPYNYKISRTTLYNPDFTSANSLKIYPNPTSSKVSFDNTIEKFETATVINYLGQVVSEIRFSSFEANQEVNLSSFTAGVYLVKFTNNDKSITQKIIKE